jgi:hypothetical protein
VLLAPTDLRSGGLRSKLGGAAVAPAQDPVGVSVPDLQAYLEQQLPGLLTGPLEVTLLAGGGRI